jgi:hypothetical protein
VIKGPDEKNPSSHIHLEEDNLEFCEMHESQDDIEEQVLHSL